MDAMPRSDLTQIIFWPKQILTDLDSQLLIQQHRETLGFYQLLHKQLTTDPDSPYAQVTNSLPLEEFLWAFSLVSSRHLIMDNDQHSSDDPKMQLLIMPLLDFINHSNIPKGDC